MLPDINFILAHLGPWLPYYSAFKHLNLSSRGIVTLGCLLLSECAVYLYNNTVLLYTCAVYLYYNTVLLYTCAVYLIQ